MDAPNFRKLAVVVTSLLIGVLLLRAQASPKSLVVRAVQNPTDDDAILKAIATLNHLDPALLPDDRQLFSELIDKRMRQSLALALLSSGQKDDLYFDELAKYARLAITTTEPVWVEYDADGNAIRGKLNSTFVRWCNNLHIPLEACTKNAADYASDVYFLAEARDERARPLLRQALTSPNNGVVISALRGLAWLKDNDAITLIEENLQRFAPKLAQRIASATVDFDDPRVQPLIQKYVRDPALLQELEEAISKRKSAQQH